MRSHAEEGTVTTHDPSATEEARPQTSARASTRPTERAYPRPRGPSSLVIGTPAPKGGRLWA
jgi:hypothetical protein